MLAIVAASAAYSTPRSQDLNAELADLNLARAATEAQIVARVLKAKFGLPDAGVTLPATQPSFVTGGDPVIELIDIRLLLAQIAVQTGAKDHLALARAQNAGVHQVILLRGGRVTLTELHSLISASSSADYVSSGPQGVMLTRALVLWPDAGLTLSAGESLILSQADGSFLANLGWLDIRGASVSGSLDVNTNEPGFRPFVLTAGRGSLTVSDAQFTHLGFGDTPRFGGVSVDNSGLQPPQIPTSIITSAFDDVKVLALLSTRNATAMANTLSGAGIVIARSTNANVAGNLINGATTSAIRITSGSVETLVADNIIFGATVGISADQASQRITLSGNVLAGQSSSGIRMDKVGCVKVSGNLAVLGLGSGISLSSTGRVAIAGNAILDNLGPGILLRGQGNKASVHVSGNRFSGNREGLRGATAGELTLTDNDLEGQLPRLFAGDLSPRTIAWLEDRRSQGPARLLADLAPVCLNEGNN
jgi:poly(beta-D-mannuronate) C5 epimerase